MRLKDRTCIVTGGASGIGAATVYRFVSEGAEVLIADRAVDQAQVLAEELGPAVTWIECDGRIPRTTKPGDRTDGRPGR